MLITYPGPDGQMRTKRFTGPFMIGRDESCQVLLVGEMVSKQHVELYKAKSGWWVADLDSTNGTFVNGVQVSQRKLIDGDIIRIGSIKLKFYSQDMKE